jgi:hypothetical protein
VCTYGLSFLLLNFFPLCFSCIKNLPVAIDL